MVFNINHIMNARSILSRSLWRAHADRAFVTTRETPAGGRLVYEQHVWFIQFITYNFAIYLFIVVFFLLKPPTFSPPGPFGIFFYKKNKQYLSNYFFRAKLNWCCDFLNRLCALIFIFQSNKFQSNS